MRYVLLIGVLLQSYTLSAQVVSGKVVDSETGNPVEFASVYFVNTTTGTSTRSDGSFTLEAFSPGKYVLTVSFVGYTTYSREITLDSLDELYLDIELRPSVVNLPSIYIRADTTGWPAHFELFREQFLGTDKAAKKCTILNPKSLLFYFDKLRNKLYAHAREPLIIRNEYLGYELTYEMKSFEFDIYAGTINYLGIPRFAEMEDKKEIKKWSKNRKRTYAGSPTRFFRALKEDRLNEAGFRINRMYRTPNQRRLPDPVSCVCEVPSPWPCLPQAAHRVHHQNG